MTSSPPSSGSASEQSKPLNSRRKSCELRNRDTSNRRRPEIGVNQAGLVPFFGPEGRVSEVPARKRPLTLPMIRKLNAGPRFYPASITSRMPAMMRWRSGKTWFSIVGL